MTSGSFAGEILRQGFEGELREAEPLSPHVSLKTGGRAALFATAENEKDLRILLGRLENGRMPWVVLGGGTNTVFVNGGYKGCVLRLGTGFAHIVREDENTLHAGAAAPLPALVRSSAENALSGMECLAGIPGTVGGAVFMNAGTKGGEIGNIIREIQVFNGKGTRWISTGEMGFSYRSSSLPEGHIILGARFGLNPSSREKVRSAIQEQIDYRTRTQPSGYPCAGCWFRNPEGESAGRLIEEAGLKGERCGAAQVSEVHANFLVNLGGATTSDFLALAEKVRMAVLQRFGITLQEEVRIIDV